MNAFDINEMPCGPDRRCPTDFALGEKGDPYDEKAVKLVLGVPGLDVNTTNRVGRTMLMVQLQLGKEPKRRNFSSPTPAWT
jgi:hypothetical protein